MEHARRARDRRLRRLLLAVLYHGRVSPSGGMHGSAVLAEVMGQTAHESQGFESDRHAMALLRDLVNKGLVEEKHLERRKHQVFGPEFCEFRITDRGSRQHLQELPVDPDIEDDRVVD